MNPTSSQLCRDRLGTIVDSVLEQGPDQVPSLVEAVPGLLGLVVEVEQQVGTDLLAATKKHLLGVVAQVLVAAEPIL